MKILLIDADSTIPNIALMKLSTFHKNNGDSVKLIRLKIPYFPHIKKHRQNIDTMNYDKVYCSVIFKGSIDFVIGENIIFGGTGTDMAIKLDANIDNLKPDYTLYPDNKILYDFITRGCIRNCYFCFVPRKEGKIYQYRTLTEILDNDLDCESVEFMDNNILAHPKHCELLEQIIEKKILCSFNQGLDIRLITKENSELLHRINYNGAYKFAFDDWSLKNTIEDKLLLMPWRKPFQFRFYMYFNPSTMHLSNMNNRIKWAKKNKILPYLMRDIKCWEYEKLQPYLVDMVQWANVPAYFVNQEIGECILRYKKSPIRASKTQYIYNTNLITEYRDSVQEKINI